MATKPYADYDPIYTNLYQGSYPKLNAELLKKFDIVVYCAMEQQPTDAAIKAALKPLDPGTRKNKQVIKFPMDDDPYQPIEAPLNRQLIAQALQLASALRAGRTVLITCMMGMNRSGLLSAMTLMAASGCSGKAALDTIRTGRRPMDDGTRALFNPMFARFVETRDPRKIFP